MSGLTGNFLNGTMQSLLQIANGATGFDGTLRSVQDGNGTTCPLQLSTSSVNITALKYNGNSISIAGALTFTGAYSFTATLTNTTAVTFPTTGTLATLAGSETLTNKTLTSPVISSIVNTGTLTLPTSTDTLVGRATTDTLANKTLTTPTLTSPTMTTPILGTPQSGNLANCTNLPIASVNGYAKGTFTPVLNFGGATTGITYSVQAGNYTTVGNITFFSLAISLTSKGSATGSVTVTGFPSNPVASNEANISSIIPQNVTLHNNNMIGQITTGGVLNVWYLTSTVVTVYTDADFVNTSSLVINGFYFTS